MVTRNMIFYAESQSLKYFSCQFFLSSSKLLFLRVSIKKRFVLVSQLRVSCIYQVLNAGMSIIILQQLYETKYEAYFKQSAQYEIVISNKSTIFLYYYFYCKISQQKRTKIVQTVIIMQQKYLQVPCSVANIEFQLVHKGKKVSPLKNKPTLRDYVTQLSKTQTINSCVEVFIPSNFTHCKKQVTAGFGLLKKSVVPLKSSNMEPKGFPVRKIKTSVSYRSLSRKKQKNFSLSPEIKMAKTSRTFDLAKSQLPNQKLPQFMSKSALGHYNSLKQQSSSNWKQKRKSLIF